MSYASKRIAGRLTALLLLAACLLLPAAPARAGMPGPCTEPPPSPLVVNVKDKGAKGDGRTDDTAAIQAAIDAVKGTKGTVLVPDGTYLVEVADKKRRLNLKDDMTLRLSPGATLKAIPTKERHYAVLVISRVSNVWVIGGTLLGERDRHLGKGGEWGMGIRIGHGAKHITIIGVTAKKMWGDGFYIQDAKNVKLCEVVADNNRRQGLSIIHADGVLVSNSVFKNTRGTRPSAGIDLEPDKEEQGIKNVRIEGSKFLDNAGAGVVVAGKKGQVSKVEMSRNVFKGNYRPVSIKYAPAVAAAVCGNRQISRPAEARGGLNAYAEAIDVVTLQNDCGESGFVMNREKKRKKKKPSN